MRRIAAIQTVLSGDYRAHGKSAVPIYHCVFLPCRLRSSCCCVEVVGKEHKCKGPGAEHHPTPRGLDVC